MQRLIKKSDIIQNITDNFDKTLALSHHHHNDHRDNHDDDDGDHDDDSDNDDDFEFVIGGERNSPISADDIFQNGQIRPIFPFSDENPRNSDGATTSYAPPVKKLFVVSSPEKENGKISEGSYCELSPEKKTPVPEMSRKSNSTGFSKLWRVRDLLVRSHSDGKDAFVFLGRSEEEKKRVNVAAKIRVSKGEKAKGKVETVSKGEKVKTKAEMVSKVEEVKGKKSAYEVLYVKNNKERKGGKSYLPYRQELVGFFTNTGTGMSRNIHPY